MNSRWMESTRRALGLSAVAALAAVTLGCTTTGTGTGTVSPGDALVSFSWTSKDGGISGTMSATVGAGKAFSGPFLQMTSNVRTDSLAPLWNGWNTGWGDWNFWGSFPETEFSTRYSGKVVANLAAADGQRLRCRFHLNNPAAGMGGGGQGECQYTGGRTVDAVFRRS